MLASFNLFQFLNKNLFRTDQNKQQTTWEKKSGFVDFEFVKTCDEFVTDFVCITGTAREYGCPLGSVFKITSNGQDGVCANPTDGQ